MFLHRRLALGVLGASSACRGQVRAAHEASLSGSTSRQSYQEVTWKPSSDKQSQPSPPPSWTASACSRAAFIFRNFSSDSGVGRADGPVGHPGPPASNASGVAADSAAALGHSSSASPQPIKRLQEELLSMMVEKTVDLFRLRRQPLQRFTEDGDEEGEEEGEVGDEEAPVRRGVTLGKRKARLVELAVQVREQKERIGVLEAVADELRDEVEEFSRLLKKAAAERPTMDWKVEEGAVVRVRAVPCEVAQVIQEVRGRWDSDMERLLGETGSVAGPATADGWVPVRMDGGDLDSEGEPVLWHPLMLQLVTPVAGVPSALPLGTRVCIRDAPLQEAEKLQSGYHGGWSAERARTLGRTGVVVDAFPDGDVKVVIDGEPKDIWWWNRMMVVPLAPWERLWAF